MRDAIVGMLLGAAAGYADDMDDKLLDAALAFASENTGADKGGYTDLLSR
jgi:hypothetical protein